MRLDPNPRLFPDVETGGSGFFDLATMTGWAYGQPAEKPSCGVFDLKGNHEDGSLFSSLYEALADFIEWFKPSRLYAEAPLPPGTRSNMDAWIILIGMVGVARCVGAQYGLSIRLISASTIRGEVLRGLPWNQGLKKGKPVIMQWCHDQGLNPPAHDAADALVGLEYALRTYSRRGFAKDLAAP